MDDDTTYCIVRFCFNDSHDDHRKVIATGLSLEEAQDHCNDDATHGEDSERGPWFDGYNEE